MSGKCMLDQRPMVWQILFLIQKRKILLQLAMGNNLTQKNNACIAPQSQSTKTGSNDAKMAYSVE